MKSTGAVRFLLGIFAVAFFACARAGGPKAPPFPVKTSAGIGNKASDRVPPFVGAEDDPEKREERSVKDEAGVDGADKEGAEPDAGEATRDLNGPHRDRPAITRNLPGLESFYQSLDDLRAGRRQTPVRIYWLGDSHTAADFMTHPFREYLAGIFGDGGPGFLRLGLDGYRHGAARIRSFGTIRRAPILPAQRTRVLDGIFGYGGIRTRPESASGVTVELKTKSEDEVRWTLSYRLKAGGSLEVRLGEAKHLLPSEDSPESLESPESIRSFSVTGRADERFSVRHVSGDPELFGAFCEYTKPGIVLDTTGIDGARTATALAWEPTQYTQEVRRRDPDLLVVAYGTNEVFDQTAVARYPKHTSDLIARARDAIPELPCWVIGPPDSAKKRGGSLSRVTLVTDAQREAAEEMGCAFTSLFELMGGEGSFSRWMKERPAMARGDRVHFTISGYERLGALLAEHLVSEPADASEDRPSKQSDLPHPGTSVSPSSPSL